MVKPFDDLLEYEAFFGFESIWYVATGLGFGAVEGSNLLADLMSDYQDIPFVLENGSFDTTACPVRNSKALENNGFVMDGSKQTIDGVAVFPMEWFFPNIYHLKESTTPNTYSVYWFSGSWLSKEQKDAVEKDRKRERNDSRKAFLHKFIHTPNRVFRKMIGDKNYNKLKAKING